MLKPIPILLGDGSTPVIVDGGARLVEAASGFKYLAIGVGVLFAYLAFSSSRK